jgi:hypothetical protein
MKEVSMKKLLPVAVAALLGGCASIDNLNPFTESTDYTVSQPGDNTVAVKDQKVGLVNDEGIKIYYTLLGDLDRIEVYGVAPAWKGNVEIVAELDAKERLVKYLYDEKVNTSRSVEVLTRTIDKARDNALNKMQNGLPQDQVVEFAEEKVEAEVVEQPNKTSNNTSRRVAERIESTKISALTKITSGGTLRAMRKVSSEVRDDGRTYVAVYRWSEKDQDTANSIRTKMFAK